MRQSPHAVGPVCGGDTIARIDPGSGRTVGRPLRVGSQPHALAVGFGSVWVTFEQEAYVLRIEESSGNAIGTIGISGDDVAVGDGAVWVSGGAGLYWISP